jgi:hypothetical protein
MEQKHKPVQWGGPLNVLELLATVSRGLNAVSKLLPSQDFLSKVTQPP